MPEHLVPVAPDGPEARARRARFERNLETLVREVTRAGVPLFLCTAPSNLAAWPPAWRRVPGALEEGTVSRLRDLLSGGSRREALQAVRREQATRPDDPMLLFLEGRALQRLGLGAEARERFLRARALDPIPRRAFDGFNQAVRAQARPGVRVVDVVARLEEREQAGLVGFDLICDNCHPTPLGNAIIGREIALAMRDEGLLLPPDADVPEVATWLSQLDAVRGSAESQWRSRERWLLSNAIYSMKSPFFNFEASYRYLQQALALAPGDWRVHGNLATLSLLQGDVARGRSQLATATKLKGSALDPEDRSITPYLKEALVQAGPAPAPDAGGS